MTTQQLALDCDPTWHDPEPEPDDEDSDGGPYCGTVTLTLKGDYL